MSRKELALFTIGYEGLTLGPFIQSLLRNHIDVIADVRMNPISRKPGFSKFRLAEEIKKNGMKYIHVKELGTPRNLRDNLSLTGDYEKFRSEFRKHIEKRSEILEELYQMVRSGRVALMCFERDPEKCHRSVIALAIKSLNGNGLHIRSV